jgi:hypothetical protein
MQAVTVMKIGGLLTMLGLGTLIAGLKAGERLRANRRAAASKRDLSGNAAPPARGLTA